ncbi:CGNR zinc finger domain-containing protein [Streptomyces caatingaensis]|uniref:Zinc finger CGNR domain-containing protein n=1 Tax=Streptomyces caatingaensis TaxID=1678637 RepID=A0A0K9XDQ5_9ACTN|nr:CGNR zinc finger domain-containing protein [Streptomyces caatingaensis]KNB50762.1 hypothetical protein AC230_20100 [Streptomyces caatingaensis]
MRDAPPAARLVESFVNTVDVELGTDGIDSAERLSAWLTDQGLLPAGEGVSDADHRLGLALRAGIREELGAHAGGAPDAAVVAEAESALESLPLRAALRRSGPEGPVVLGPDPRLPAARRALATLAAVWSELLVTGESTRLKRCAEHACAWVFWDVSKNRSRRWCSMRVCGNRAKARRFAARQETAAAD